MPPQTLAKQVVDLKMARAELEGEKVELRQQLSRANFRHEQLKGRIARVEALLAEYQVREEGWGGVDGCVGGCVGGGTAGGVPGDDGRCG